MTNQPTQGLLSEITSIWEDNGWSQDSLKSFRMEFNPDGGGTGEQQQQEPSGQGQQQQVQPQQQQNPFLESIDANDRPIVEKYISKWDADVTRRFQELHSKYRPYEELGAPVEDLQYAYGIYQQLNNDPQAFYAALTEALKDDSGEQGLGNTNGNGNDLPFQGLPEEFQTEYQKTRQAVEAMAAFILEQQESQMTQQEDAELDQYLKGLKDKHGEFDEEYVLAKMYATGCDGEQAITAWKQAVQQFINQTGGAPKRTPKVLSGGGSVPSEVQKVTDLSRKDTKKLVEQIMANSVQET